MNTTHINAQTAEHSWYVIDAQDLVVGRLATRIATVLRGKHKPTFTRHVDNGDFVVVVNADKVRFTGTKMDDKQYHQYSGYPGGLKSLTARQMVDRAPERILMAAVKGMLPKNRLSRQVIKKLKIYAGPEHPHAAQKPVPFPEYV